MPFSFSPDALAAIAGQAWWALFGALIGVVMKPLSDYVRSRNGEFSGRWKQITPPHEGEPEKIAIVQVRHVGDTLYARTERITPKLAFLQRWKVEARVKRGLVFGMYWPEDSAKLPGSYGTLQFKIRDENLFDGFYVRARNAPVTDVNQYSESLKTIPLRWERMVGHAPDPSGA